MRIIAKKRYKEDVDFKLPKTYNSPMKELDFEEKRYQSILDSARRDKKRYHYASDITFREGIVTEPNTVVRDIISQDIPYGRL